MNLRYLTLFVVCLICCVPAAYAQWDAQISQYWVVKPYYNPAFAGATSNLEVTGLHRQQWIGITNAPKTTIISGNMPMKFLGRTHGVGVLVMTESIGLFKNTSFNGQYVYKKKFGKNMLNGGVQLGLFNINFDASKIHIPPGQEGEIEKPTSSGEKSSAFDASIGLSWIAPNYYAGISIAHPLEPTFDIDDTHSSYIAKTYYLTGGYNIQLRNPLYELQPSFLVKSDGVLTQYDVTARMVYNKMFNGGLSWRKDDGFVFLLGITIKGFDAGYAYDLSTSAISKASSGSHELFLRYSMPINLTKGKKNGHKSVRIL